MGNKARPFRPAVLLYALCIVLFAAAVPIGGEVCGAEAKEPRAVFTAGDPDSDGYFTLDLTLYDATFNVFQFCVRFNPEVIKTASFADGSITKEFRTFAEQKDDGWMSAVGTSVSLEKGLLDFTGYVAPGQNGKGIVNEAGEAVAGPTGLHVFSFRFKKIGEGDPGILLAASENGDVYNKSLPDGGGLARAGLPMATRIVFNIADSIGKSSETVQNTDSGNRGGSAGSGSTSGTPQTAAAGAISREERIKDTVILQIGNPAAAVEGKLSRIDTANDKVMPFVKNQRTYVPLAFLSERLKAEVSWDGIKEEVTVKKDGTVIIVPVGADYYLLNGTKYPQDAPAEVTNQRTFVPIAFIGRALGRDVFWEPKTESVIITSADQPWQANRSVEQEVLNDSLLIMSPLIRNFSK